MPGRTLLHLDAYKVKLPKGPKPYIPFWWLNVPGWGFTATECCGAASPFPLGATVAFLHSTGLHLGMALGCISAWCCHGISAQCGYDISMQHCRCIICAAPLLPHGCTAPFLWITMQHHHCMNTRRWHSKLLHSNFQSLLPTNHHAFHLVKIMIKMHKNTFSSSTCSRYAISWAMPSLFGTVAYIKDGEAKYFALGCLLSVAVFQVM